VTPRTSTVADDIPTVNVPRAALDDLIHVAAYVSLGRRAIDHQPDGAPYPDAVARRALGALDDTGLQDAGSARYRELLDRVQAAGGAELASLGQAVAIAYIDEGVLSENEYTTLQNRWMTRLRQLVGPEEALRHCGEAVHAAGKRPCTMDDIHIFEDVNSARSPGWYIARCDRLDCGWETSGAEPVCEEAAEAHVHRSQHPEDGD
jgi:hypothetical protein